MAKSYKQTGEASLVPKDCDNLCQSSKLDSHIFTAVIWHAKIGSLLFLTGISPIGHKLKKPYKQTGEASLVPILRTLIICAILPRWTIFTAAIWQANFYSIDPSSFCLSVTGSFALKEQAKT